MKTKLVDFASDVKNKMVNNKLVNASISIYSKHEFIIDLMLILLYKISFDAIYILVISPVYAYSGFTTDISVIRYLTSLITVLIFAVPIVGLYKQKNFSSTMLLIINLIYFIPLTSLYAFMGFGTMFYVLSVVYWGILMILQYKIPTLKVKKIQNSKLSNRVIYLITAVISISVIYVSWRYTGFRITLDFINVYDTREEASTYNLPTIISYLISFSGISLPILALFALKNKKWFMLVFLCAIFVLGYSIGTHKTTFFIFVIAIIAYFIYRDGFKKLFALGLSCISFICIALYFLTGHFVIPSLIFRRVMAVPVQLSSEYFTFFAENDLNIFRHGILDNVGFNRVYDYSVAQIVGESIYGHMDTNANNGMLGDAFANIGIVGIIIMPIILIIIFRLLDAVSHNLDSRVGITACIYFAVSFTNTSWSTILLTHGFLVACLLLYFFTNNQNGGKLNGKI